jgi:hypothetical protein
MVGGEFKRKGGDRLLKWAETAGGKNVSCQTVGLSGTPFTVSHQHYPGLHRKRRSQATALRSG